MKIPRETLKAIVKELLLEILNEGLQNTSSVPSVAPRTPVNVHEHRRRISFDPNLDRRISPMPSRTPSPQLLDAVKRESGGNSIMESILADTARTTLPSMLSNDSVAAPAAQEQFTGTPEEVFGEESASRWASLAFMDGSPKKSA